MIKDALPKVFLRAMEPEDLHLIYEVENDEGIWDMGVTNVPYSQYLLLDYISNATGDIYADKQVRLIVENEAHEAVGIADLMDFDPKHNRAELGIVIKKPFRKQGYGRASIAKIAEYGKKVLHLHQIFSFVAENNISSVRMLQESGFQKSTVLKDWLFDGKEYHGAYFFQRFF